MDKNIQLVTDTINEKYKNTIKDSARPYFHFASPCNMLIDVWGGIFHKGYYHLFYDISHKAEMQGGSFGHVRSFNLTEWENLPIALVPEEEKGERNLNDGTVVIDKNGEPLMYYTRCFFDGEKNREHVAVKGSQDLIQWERLYNGEAVLTMENHGGPKFHMSWSDPIIFHEQGRTFMIISKCTVPGEGDMIPIYEATDDTWLKWEYKGVFAEHTGEVLNFIKIKDKWVLIYSPYNNPKYFVGTFDIEKCKFICENEGVLSYGYVQQGYITGVSRGFYATSAFEGEQQIPYIIGWISGFEDTKGWEGCVSLPRTLDIDKNNKLIMNPAPVLDSLREEKLNTDDIENIKCSKAFELNVEFIGDITVSVDDSFRLEIKKNHIKFNDIEFDYDMKEKCRLRMYIDVCIGEIFVDDGKISIARCFKQLSENSVLKIQSDGKIINCYAYKEKKLYE